MSTTRKLHSHVVVRSSRVAWLAVATALAAGSALALDPPVQAPSAAAAASPETADQPCCPECAMRQAEGGAPSALAAPSDAGQAEHHTGCKTPGSHAVPKGGCDAVHARDTVDAGCGCPSPSLALGARGQPTALPPRPRIAIGTDAYYVKPILAVAAGLHGEDPIALPAGATLERRGTTFALSRFGLEGRLGPYVTFKSEFERNMKAHGSGIWEGTAAFSAREQVLRLSRWGLGLDVGIIVDPASVDFMTVHAADALLADKYTRDPLLFSGFNRGQGLLASYRWRGLSASLSYTASNPISTSLSYQVGGNFGNAGRFWEQPLGGFDSGHQPNDRFHFTVLSPSLALSTKYFEARATAQLFAANTDTTSRDDPRITGANLRGGVLGKIPVPAPLPVVLRPFFNVASVTNSAKNNDPSHSNELLKSAYTALTLSGGLDVMLWERSGLGASYVRTSDRSPQYIAGGTEEYNLTAQEYLNVGATYWLTDEVALGVRYAFWARLQTNRLGEEVLWRDQSFFASLRVQL